MSEQMQDPSVQVQSISLRDHQEGIPGLAFKLKWVVCIDGCEDRSDFIQINSLLPRDEEAITAFLNIIVYHFPEQAESLSAEFFAALLPYENYVSHPLLQHMD